MEQPIHAYVHSFLPWKDREHILLARPWRPCTQPGPKPKGGDMRAWTSTYTPAAGHALLALQCHGRPPMSSPVFFGCAGQRRRRRQGMGKVTWALITPCHAGAKVDNGKAGRHTHAEKHRWHRCTAQAQLPALTYVYILSGWNEILARSWARNCAIMRVSGWCSLAVVVAIVVLSNPSSVHSLHEIKERCLV